MAKKKASLWKRFLCLILGHRGDRPLNPKVRSAAVICARCGRQWPHSLVRFRGALAALTIGSALAPTDAGAGQALPPCSPAFLSCRVLVLAQTTAPIPGYQPVAGYIGARITNGTNSAAVMNSAPVGTEYGVVVRVAGAASDGAIVDGDSATKADVFDYTNSNPLAVRLTDTVGDYVAAGGGTQYTEDAVSAADPVGNQMIGRRRDALATETSTDGDVTALNVTGKGELYVKQVDAVTITDGAGAVNVIVDSGTVTANAGTGTFVVGDGAGALNVIVDSGAVTATLSQTGSANDVDVLTMPSVTVGTFPDNEPINVAQMNGTAVTMGNGVSGTGVQRVTIASDSTGQVALASGSTVATTQATASSLNAEVQGDAATDVAVSGNPVLGGGRSVDADFAAPNVRVTAEGEAVSTAMSRDGVTYVHTFGPHLVEDSDEYTTQQTDTAIIAAPGAGLSIYISSVVITCNGAATVTLEDDEVTDDLILRHYCDAAGSGIVWSPPTPYKQAANQALLLTTSAATTLSVTVTGFVAP